MRGFGAAWLSTIGVDLVAFTALQLLQVGSINYTPLFALPVLMAAVLGTGCVGLGTTAAASRCCCWPTRAGTGCSSRAIRSPRFVQAALTGTGLFVVALLAHQLARAAGARRSAGTAQPQRCAACTRRSTTW